jgi:putative addiction module killer protein/probable addiction module antidote protein
LKKLRDVRGKARIIRRLDRLAQGNPGDVRPIGKGLSELRLDVGPGYRVYYLQDGDTLILLLCGGDKSTQQKDIDKAHELADQWHQDEKEGKQLTTSEKYKRFDAADYLENLDDVTAFLEVALEDSIDDPSAVPHALGIIARSQNMSELARRVGMSRDGLYKALSADGNPNWSTILKVTNALGLRFELHTVAS